jgi:REP element-mobilizing transposase RayT
MAWTRKSRPSEKRYFNGKHRYEHWYRDNQVYFITARVNGRRAAFATDEAKSVFWLKFDQYTSEYEFTPIVTSLLDNHYHVLGYAKRGSQLGEMMRKLHGSVAKLVNDLLPGRVVPFWGDERGKDYFDGCIRDVLQMRRTFRYVHTQCRRHHVCKDPRDYPHTRVGVELERAVRRAVELGAFLYGVPYRRYEGY